MQTKNSFPLQNIIGRITHGLIGLDIFLKEKKTNTYLDDFLTLKEEEIKAALVSAYARTKLVPPAEIQLSEEQSATIKCVIRTQKMISNLDKVNSEKEIEASIEELGMKLDVIYQAMLSE